MVKTFLIGLFLSGFALADNTLPKDIGATYEGIYEVTVKHMPSETNPQCTILSGASRMVVLNSTSDTGITVSLVPNAIPIPRYIFLVNRLENQGAFLEGNSFTTGGRLAEFQVEKDAAGNLLGWIRDAECLFDLRVTGKQVASPVVYYETSGTLPALSQQSFIGSYTGTAGAIKGTLTIRPSGTSAQAFIATFYDPQGKNRLNFSLNQFLPQNRVSNFISPNTRPATHVKWTITSQENPLGGNTLSGIGYSSFAGMYYPLNFTKRSSTPLP